jgi:hypothetical protein
MQIHFSQCSNHCLKAVANSLGVMVWMTPNLCLLEAVLIQGEAGQLLLHPPEQEGIRWSQVRQIGGGGESAEAFGCGGWRTTSSHWRQYERASCPNGNPFLLDHLWPLLQMHREFAQGLGDVVGIDGGAPGHDVGVDQQHLFRPAGMHLALMGPGWPFCIHFLDCFLISGIW